MEETRSDLTNKLAALESQVADRPGRYQRHRNHQGSSDRTVESVKETVETVTEKLQETVSGVTDSVQQAVKESRSRSRRRASPSRKPSTCRMQWSGTLGGVRWAAVGVGFLGGWLSGRFASRPSQAASKGRSNPRRITQAAEARSDASPSQPEPSGGSSLGELSAGWLWTTGVASRAWPWEPP